MKRMIVGFTLLLLASTPVMASKQVTYNIVQMCMEADAAVMAAASEKSRDATELNISKVILGDLKVGKLTVIKVPAFRDALPEEATKSEQLIFLRNADKKWSLLGSGCQAVWPGNRYANYAAMKSGTDVKILVNLCEKIRSFEKMEPSKRQEYASELAFNKDLFMRVIGLELCQYLRDNKKGVFTPEMELLSSGGLEYLQKTVIADITVFSLSVNVATTAPSSVVLETLIRPIGHPSVGQAEKRNAAMSFKQIAGTDFGYPLQPEKLESEKAREAVAKMQAWLQKHRGELLRNDLPKINEHLDSDDVVMRRIGRIWLEAIPHDFAYKEDADEESRSIAVKAFTQYVEALPFVETDIASTQTASSTAPSPPTTQP